ncbi:MAG: hypothetical protein ACREID_01595 [Planctomycetota bacterium]
MMEGRRSPRDVFVLHVVVAIRAAWDLLSAAPRLKNRPASGKLLPPRGGIAKR